MTCPAIWTSATGSRIADLAKISEDLTARAVADTVVVHSSGLHLLLAPDEIRDTEYVTPEAVRRIIGQLRTLYHLVGVDVGSAITTTQAAAVESADLHPPAGHR